MTEEFVIPLIAKACRLMDGQSGATRHKDLELEKFGIGQAAAPSIVCHIGPRGVIL